jgi:hypothetical protein
MPGLRQAGNAIQTQVSPQRKNQSLPGGAKK